MYLGEDEVTEQVSSLKKDASAPILLGPDEEGFGLRNATLKWNEVEPEKKAGESTHVKSSSAESVGTADSASTIDIGAADNGNGDHKFELKDVSVMFPDGELSVITGPTASGKTALLVSIRILSSAGSLTIAYRWPSSEK